MSTGIDSAGGDLPAGPTPSHSPRYDPAQLRRFLDYILDPSAGCTELRILHAKKESTRPNAWIVHNPNFASTMGGYYDSIPILADDLHYVKGVSAFLTVNPVIRDLMARSNSNSIGQVQRGGGTNAGQIAYWRRVLVDLDAKRPADISSTDEELARAVATRDRLLADHPDIAAAAIWGCSGNGCYVLPWLPDYPVDEEHNALIARFLAVLGRKYGDEHVEVDQKTKDPSRVMGIAGLRKCKGSDQPDRPWRLATIDSPEGHVPVPLDLREWLDRNDDGLGVASGPPARPGRPSGGTRTPPGPPAGGQLDSRLMVRITTFLAAIPGAISGQGGHDQTFSVATALVKGVGLSVSDAWLYLLEYNRRCEPPWTDAELWHKIEDAHDKPDTRPRGYLLAEEGPGRAAQAMPARGQVFDVSGVAGPAQGGREGPAGAPWADDDGGDGPPPDGGGGGGGGGDDGGPTSLIDNPAYQGFEGGAMVLVKCHHARR